MRRGFAVLTLWLFALCAIIAGCGSSSGGSDGPTSYSISGMVIDGPISNASCSAYQITNTGAKGPKLAGPVLTSSTGAYTLTTTIATPLMVECTGGSLVDWATGTTVTLTSGDAITAVGTTAGGSATIGVTPLTHMAAALALQSVASGSTVAGAIADANGRIAQYFGLDNILTVQPMNPTVAGSAAAATQAQKNYALILAGISKYAQTNAVANPLDLVDALAADASDGALDGMQGSAPIPLGAGNLSATATGVELAGAIAAFALSTQNASNLTVPTDLSGLLGGADGTIGAFVASVAVSPATKTLTTAGGTFTLEAKAKSLTGEVLASQPDFTFTSADESVATVDSAGVVTAIANGTVAITAAAKGKSASCAVTVAISAAPVINSIIVTPGLKTLTAAGETFTLAVSAVDSLGVAVDPQPSFTFLSLDTGVATVSSAGVVTAVANGTTAIEVRAGGKMSDCNVTVEISGGGGGGSGTAAAYLTKKGVGSHWSYQQSQVLNSGTPNLSTETITITASDAGGFDYSSTQGRTGRVEISASGALTDTSDGVTQTYLPATFDVGTQYVMTPASSGQAQINGTIAAFNQTKTVPGGTFTDCVRINYTKDQGSGIMVTATIYWSATAGSMIEHVATVTGPGMVAVVTSQLQAGWVANP